jgi:serine protein kinase
MREGVMQGKTSDVFDLFSEIYTDTAREEMSLQQYLLACCEDSSMYASAP